MAKRKLKARRATGLTASSALPDDALAPQPQPPAAHSLSSLRLWAAALALGLVWLFPFSYRPSPVLAAQIFAAASVAVAGLLVARRLPDWRLAALLGLCALLVTLNGGTYADHTLAAVAALLMAWVATSVGQAAVDQPRLLTAFIVTLVLAALLSAVIGVLQYFGLTDELRPWIALAPERGRVSANLNQANLLATLLCCALASVLWLHRTRRLGWDKAWGAAVLLQVGLSLTGSRVGGLEVLALAGLTLLWRRGQTRSSLGLALGQIPLYVALAALVATIGPLVGASTDSVWTRLLGAHHDSRLTLWANMAQLVAQRPWLGWGWTELGYGQFLLDTPVRFDQALTHAHNLPLHLAVELGLPVALGFCLLALGLVLRAKPWRETQAERQWAWTVLALIGLHSLLEFPLWTGGFLCCAALALGVLLPAQPVLALRRAARPLQLALSAALLLYAALAAAQYRRVNRIYETPYQQAPEAKRQAIADAQQHWLGRWLLVGYGEFAELAITPVTPANAEQVQAQSEKLLHFAAEPRVITPALVSSVYTQQWDKVRLYSRQFCATYPADYRRWRNGVEQRQAGAAWLGNLAPCP